MGVSTAVGGAAYMVCRYREMRAAVLVRCSLLRLNAGLNWCTTVRSARVADQAGAGYLPDDGYPRSRCRLVRERPRRDQEISRGIQ